MRIAIIGSGNVGKALATSATKAGHHVTLSARSPEKAREAAQATKARAAPSNQDAVKEADLVVLAVPADKVDEVVGALAPELDGKVIIDVTNRVDMKDPGKTLDGSSMSEHIQKKAPQAHVVKAFNYAFASKMADPRSMANGWTGLSPATMNKPSRRPFNSSSRSASGPSTQDRLPWRALSKAWRRSTSSCS